MIWLTRGFDEPEDFLIMAFLLGLLDEWNQALVLIDKCRQVIAHIANSSIPGRIIPSEVDYFSSTIKLRLGQMTADPATAADWYLSAYEDMRRAREANSEDPRYLMGEAAAAMLYREGVKSD